MKAMKYLLFFLFMIQSSFAEESVTVKYISIYSVDEIVLVIDDIKESPTIIAYRNGISSKYLVTYTTKENDRTVRVFSNLTEPFRYGLVLSSEGLLLELRYYYLDSIKYFTFKYEKYQPISAIFSYSYPTGGGEPHELPRSEAIVGNLSNGYFFDFSPALTYQLSIALLSSYPLQAFDKCVYFEIYQLRDIIDSLGMFDLKLFRNYFFAKYGYRFKDDGLQKIFSETSWYTIDTTYDGNISRLTPKELEILQLIIEEEKSR